MGAWSAVPQERATPHATSAYVGARAIVGYPETDRERILVEALEAALYERGRTQDKLYAALDRTVALEGELEGAKEEIVDLHETLDELEKEEKAQ